MFNLSKKKKTIGNVYKRIASGYRVTKYWLQTITTEFCGTMLHVKLYARTVTEHYKRIMCLFSSDYEITVQ